MFHSFSNSSSGNSKTIISRTKISLSHFKNFFFSTSSRFSFTSNHDYFLLIFTYLRPAFLTDFKAYLPWEALFEEQNTILLGLLNRIRFLQPETKLSFFFIYLWLLYTRILKDLFGKILIWYFANCNLDNNLSSQKEIYSLSLLILLYDFLHINEIWYF